MPYIGRGPAKSGAFRILDDLSTGGSGFNGVRTSFALTVGSAALTVGLPETLLIAVDGVVQEAGSAYTISGSDIVFTAAPQESATFWGVELGDVGGIAQQAVTQSASDDSTSIATTAYVDNQIDVQLTAEDLDVTGDSGTIAIDLDSEALAITGGTGITTAATGNAVNIVGHVEAHTVASHSDTTGTGAELETLTDGSNAESLHTHTHTVVSHSDTTATGAELETLTDGSNAESLHTHTHTVVSHSDTSITGAELTQLSGISANVTDTNLNALTAGSGNTTLHSHAGGLRGIVVLNPQGIDNTTTGALGVIAPHPWVGCRPTGAGNDGSAYFTGSAPSDFTTLNSAKLVCLGVQGSTYVRLGALTCKIAAHSEINTTHTNTIAVANHYITTNEIMHIDISSLFTSLAASDSFALGIRRNGSHGDDTVTDFYVYSIILEYS